MTAEFSRELRDQQGVRDVLLSMGCPDHCLQTLERLTEQASLNAVRLVESQGTYGLISERLGPTMWIWRGRKGKE